MVGDDVDGAHPVHVLGRVGAPKEEDLAGELLADHLREVGRAVAAVEGAHVSVGLLEAGVLSRGDGQVADHVQRVAPAGRPAGDDGDDDLGHGPDEALDLEDMKTPALCHDPCAVDGVSGLALGILVARAPADALVAAGAERPRAVLGRRAVAGEQHDTHVGGHPGVVEGPVELVDRVRSEGVQDLGAVEGDPHGAQPTGAVVGDVREVEPRHDVPRGRVEDGGHLLRAPPSLFVAHGGEDSAAVGPRGRRPSQRGVLRSRPPCPARGPTARGTG